MTTDVLLTLHQAARRLAVRPSMILRLIRRRDLAAVKVGRAWRIEPQAIAAYITAHRTEASVLETPTPVDDRQLPLPITDADAADAALRLTLAEVDAFRRTWPPDGDLARQAERA